jgi:tetratricopeptide (TPR) repeat protein
MLSCPKSLLVPVSLLTVFLCALSIGSFGQAHSEQVQIKPPLLRTIEPPAPDATAADLESRADQLHAEKLYFDAIDYYRASLTKLPNNAKVLNKICRTQLVMAHWKDAQRTCEQAIRADRAFADSYSNLGVALYKESKYGAAIKQYRRAIALDDSSATFFVNLGAALFSKKQFEPAVAAYQHALQLDPDSFLNSSRGGVQAQLPGPEDRARFAYTVAKLYAKMGYSDRSLEYLRKAMEEGYKDFKDVYKDAEFAELRKDKRFAELVAVKTPALPE